MISDEKWLQFLIEQLLINSIKYSLPQKSVLLEGAVYDGSAVLRIIDRGIGIPAGDLPRVKRPFFTGENGRKQGEATGMGLYLADRVASELGIDFEITSEVGIGTTVTLVFPDMIVDAAD